MKLIIDKLFTPRYDLLFEKTYDYKKSMIFWIGNDMGNLWETDIGYLQSLKEKEIL